MIQQLRANLDLFFFFFFLKFPKIIFPTLVIIQSYLIIMQ